MCNAKKECRGQKAESSIKASTHDGESETVNASRPELARARDCKTLVFISVDAVAQLRSSRFTLRWRNVCGQGEAMRGTARVSCRPLLLERPQPAEVGGAHNPKATSVNPGLFSQEHRRGGCCWMRAGVATHIGAGGPSKPVRRKCLQCQQPLPHLHVSTVVVHSVIVPSCCHAKSIPSVVLMLQPCDQESTCC